MSAIILCDDNKMYLAIPHFIAQQRKLHLALMMQSFLLLSNRKSIFFMPNQSLNEAQSKRMNEESGEIPETPKVTMKCR